MADVTAFPGVSQSDKPRDAQPCSEVVQFIEGLLEEAKRGEIQAIAVAYVRPDNVTGDGFCNQGGGHTTHTLFAAVCDLQYSYAKARWENGVYGIPFGKGTGQ